MTQHPKPEKTKSQWYGCPHCTGRNYRRYPDDEDGSYYYVCESCRKQFFRIANWVENNGTQEAEEMPPL